MPGLTTIIRLYPPVLPPGYCLTTLQALANDFFAGATAEFRSDIGNSFFNYGDDLPSAENRIYPWFRTVGGFPDDWYIFVTGAWLALYPSPQSTGERRLWADTETALLTFDGGENAPVSLTTGPFWEIDTAMAGRSPMGPGDIPDSNPAVTLGVNDQIGSGSHLISSAEIAEHQHLSPWFSRPSLIEPTSNEFGHGPILSGASNVVDDSAGTYADRVYPFTSKAGNETPTELSLVQPVVGWYGIKRTGRKYKRVDP